MMQTFLMKVVLDQCDNAIEECEALMKDITRPPGRFNNIYQCLKDYKVLLEQLNETKVVEDD